MTAEVVLAQIVIPTLAMLVPFAAIAFKRALDRRDKEG